MNKLKHQPPTQELADARALLSQSGILIDNTKGAAYDVHDVDLIKDMFRQRGIISSIATILCGSKQANVLYRIIVELYDDHLDLGIDKYPSFFEFMKNGIKFTVIEVHSLYDWRMIIIPEPIVIPPKK